MNIRPTKEKANGQNTRKKNSNASSIRNSSRKSSLHSPTKKLSGCLNQTEQNPKSNSQPQKPKRERRSKETTFQRNYVCGCGKTYLSYAALYTHAKTKHEGVFPEGTATLHKKKGGRPKRDEWSNARFNSEYQRTYDFNRDFQAFLEKVPDAKDDSDKKSKNLIECFPCEIFASENDYREVLISLEQIRQEMLAYHGPSFLSQIDVIIFEINNGKKLTCNQVFALFLVYAFRFISTEFYRELAFLLMGYRRMMNDLGWEKFRELNEPQDIDMSQEFCSSQNAELVPDFANKFMLDYFLECIHGPHALGNTDRFVYFGMDPQKLLWAIMIIRFFCQWLFIHKLTKARIDIKRD
jgi:hypothetical protein